MSPILVHDSISVWCPLQDITCTKAGFLWYFIEVIQVHAFCQNKYIVNSYSYLYANISWLLKISSGQNFSRFSSGCIFLPDIFMNLHTTWFPSLVCNGGSFNNSFGHPPTSYVIYLLCWHKSLKKSAFLYTTTWNNKYLGGAYIKLLWKMTPWSAHLWTQKYSLKIPIKIVLGPKMLHFVTSTLFAKPYSTLVLYHVSKLLHVGI